MRRSPTSWCGAAGAVLTAILATAWAQPLPAATGEPAGGSTAEVADPAAAAGSGEGSTVGEAISIQRAARKQWLELIQTMQQVAKDLEATEPEAARTLASAARKAQEALISDDMTKVIQFLQDGMVVPADATQAEVIRKLKAVLETLRGGDLRLKDRLERLRAWEGYLKSIDANLQRQRELEEHSQHVMTGDEEAQTLEALASQIHALAEQERQIKKNTEALEADPNVRKLVEAREAIRALARKQAALDKATTSALALAAEAQGLLGSEAGKAAEHLDLLAKDADLARAMKDAGVDPNAAEVAGRHTHGAAEEMQKTSAALAQGEATAAAQAAVDSHLHDAEQALTDAIEKMSGAQQAGQLTDAQEDLRQKTDEVAAAVAKAEATPPDAPNTVAQAAEHMGQAAEHLQNQDKPQALDREGKALEALEAEAARLEQKAAALKEAAANPEYAEHQDQQEDLAKDSSELSQQMAGTPPENSEEEPEAAPGQPSVQAASENQEQAAGQLGQQNASAARDSQNQAIRNLEKARTELSEAINQEKEAAQQQALAEIEARLRKVLEEQKRLSAGTKDVHAKTKADGSFDRAEKVRLGDLANGEGKLAEETGAVVQLLEEEGTTIVFPSILQEIREDLSKTQELLASEQPGPLTQGIQQEIEARLQDRIEALQEELADRREKNEDEDSGEGEGEGQEPLVSILAELKMLRTLQSHINHRTVLLDETRRAGQASETVVEVQHKVLADRQNKVGKMTRDLAEILKNRSR